MTNVVAQFLALAGLVEPVGWSNGPGGRPARAYCGSGLSGGCVAGSRNRASTLLASFLPTWTDGKLEKPRVSLERQSSSPPLVCKRIGEEVRDLLRKLSQTEDQLLELVVGVPAIVNVQEGIVMALSALKDWSNVPLGAMLAREFKCNVTIENDTNLAAQGEHYRGAAQGERNFAFYCYHWRGCRCRYFFCEFWQHLSRGGVAVDGRHEIGYLRCT